jgi:RNA polymerase sigma-70 factor, ECF subfamily
MDIGESVTQWLRLWQDGDQEAIDRVTALVYQDLRRLAAYHLHAEANANTLQPTALVHEAYLRVAAIRNVDWQGRSHFIAVVTGIMRRILVDHARARKAAKRDPSSADPQTPVIRDNIQLDILAVDQALERMAAHYPRCSKVVELRFFGDLEFQEIAQVMEISLATVERDWRFARAWLQKAMNP